MRRARVAPLALSGHGPEFLALMRAEMRAGLMDYRAHFEHYRRLFFFCDLQPENCTRFNITFEDRWTEGDGGSEALLGGEVG